jgi:acylglycerol lipase
MRHIEGTFEGQGGLKLYRQAWLPEGEVKAVLTAVHGLAEHSGRYESFAEYFTSLGYAVYSYDHQGHGRSDGLRCYVDRFSVFIRDLDTFVKGIRTEYPDHKIFLVGHSMGGTIAASYCVGHQEKCDGLILSAAALKLGSSVPAALRFIAPVLSFLIPKAGLYSIKSSDLSHSEDTKESYCSDPLVYNGKIPTRTGIELLRTIEGLPDHFSDIRLPLLILHGTDDRLSEPSGSKALYENASSDDKVLKFYEGFYHELLNENGREKVLLDVEEWLKKRIQRI